MTTILPFAPKEPETLAETGLPESSIEQLILKILYFRGDLYGQDLSIAIGLKFSLIENLVETLKLKHHLQVRRSLGMGSVGAVFGLTESGSGASRQPFRVSARGRRPTSIRRRRHVGPVAPLRRPDFPEKVGVSR